MLPFRVRVRNRTYLWGGADVRQEIKSSLYLHFRVDETGETIRFGTLNLAGVATEIGSLKAGECYTVKLDSLVGVYAAIADPDDTFVDCIILTLP